MACAEVEKGREGTSAMDAGPGCGNVDTAPKQEVGAWLAQLVEGVTLDLEVVSSSPTLGVEITCKQTDMLVRKTAFSFSLSVTPLMLPLAGELGGGRASGFGAESGACGQPGPTGGRGKLV